MAGIGLGLAICGASGTLLCGAGVAAGYGLATRFGNEWQDHRKQSLATDARRALFSGGKAGVKSVVQKVYVNLWKDAWTILKGAR